MLLKLTASLIGAFLPAQGPLAAPPPADVDCAHITLKENRESAFARFKAGEKAIEASKWPEAEGALRQAVTSDPTLAVAHYGLGQTYMSLQRFADAVQAFTRARDAFRCFPISAEDRKRRSEEIIELREAVRTLDQRRIKDIAVKWKDMNGDATTSGAKMRTIQEAEMRLSELERSLKDKEPSPPGVTLALGTALFQTGAIAEAEVEFRAVLARDAGSGDAHHNLALVLTITDRLDEAEREIAATEKTGVPVHPRLKEELDRRKALKPR